MTWLKIWWLKRRLRNDYHRATRWQEYMDCSRTLAVHINPNIRAYEERFNATLDALTQLDPTAPTTRF